MSRKMSNAPVYYALAQVRFSPVALMSGYVEKIQDQLRRGYSLFETQRLTELVLPISEQVQQVEPQIAHTHSWLITHRDRISGFILTPSAITYHTTHYETHREFIPELLKGLEVVHKVVSLDHISRLGLRYLNAVVPKAGEEIEQYLVTGLHGISFASVQQYMLTESVFRTKTEPLVSEGTLISRVYKMTAPLGFPKDLFLRDLEMNQKFRLSEPREHAVIDTDHYVEGPMMVEVDKLEEQLLSLHTTITSVFAATTTDHAREVWA